MQLTECLMLQNEFLIHFRSIVKLFMATFHFGFETSNGFFPFSMTKLNALKRANTCKATVAEGLCIF